MDVKYGRGLDAHILESTRPHAVVARGCILCTHFRVVYRYLDNEAAQVVAMAIPRDARR